MCFLFGIGRLLVWVWSSNKYWWESPSQANWMVPSWNYPSLATQRVLRRLNEIDASETHSDCYLNLNPPPLAFAAEELQLSPATYNALLCRGWTPPTVVIPTQLEQLQRNNEPQRRRIGCDGRSTNSLYSFVSLSPKRHTDQPEISGGNRTGNRQSANRARNFYLSTDAFRSPLSSSLSALAQHRNRSGINLLSTVYFIYIER